MLYINKLILINILIRLFLLMKLAQLSRFFEHGPMSVHIYIN